MSVTLQVRRACNIRDAGPRGYRGRGSPARPLPPRSVRPGCIDLSIGRVPFSPLPPARRPIQRVPSHSSLIPRAYYDGVTPSQPHASTAAALGFSLPAVYRFFTALFLSRSERAGDAM